MVQDENVSCRTKGASDISLDHSGADRTGAAMTARGRCANKQALKSSVETIALMPYLVECTGTGNVIRGPTKNVVL